MKELKLCPFCGGTARLTTNFLAKRPFSYVQCLSCETATKNYDVCPEWNELTVEEAGEQSKKIAVEKWNTRKNESEGGKNDSI